MVVFVVIGLLAVWLLIALVCVGLCMSAAQGDRGITSRGTVRLASGPRRFSRGFRPAA